MESPQIISNANSKGLIENYLNSSTSSRYGVLGYRPNFDPETALKIIRNDPVVRGEIVKLVDKIFESQWSLFGKHKKSKLVAREDTFRSKLRGHKYLKKIAFNLILYNNAFGEIVKKRGEVSDLNVLETSLMRIDADNNGDVISYFQEVGGRQQNPSWTPNEIVHYKLDDYTSNVWAEFNIEALYETVLLKDYVRQWLSWFFGTNQLRPLFNIKSGATEKSIKDFLQRLKQSEKDLRKPHIIEGEVTRDMLQKFSDEGKSILDVLQWCDEQISIVMQLPPIAVGKPDQSGRSNSVEQFQTLNTRILSIQREIEDSTNYDLFPKIGFDTVEFRFGVLDETARKTAFEVVQLMKNSQFTDEAITEYLSAVGIVFDTEKLFKQPEDFMGLSNKDVGTGNEGSIGNKSSDAAPSRQRQGNGLSEANKKVMVRNAFERFADKMRYW